MKELEEARKAVAKAEDEAGEAEKAAKQAKSAAEKAKAKEALSEAEAKLANARRDVEVLETVELTAGNDTPKITVTAVTNRRRAGIRFPAGIAVELNPEAIGEAALKAICEDPLLNVT